MLDVDDSSVNVGNDGGIVNQSHWAKESSNVGLQPLNRPTEESTLKEEPHSEIGDVLLGEFCRSHGICDTCFRH